MPAFKHRKFKFHQLIFFNEKSTFPKYQCILGGSFRRSVIFATYYLFGEIPSSSAWKTQWVAKRRRRRRRRGATGRRRGDGDGCLGVIQAC